MAEIVADAEKRLTGLPFWDINETLSAFVRATMQPRSENEVAEIIGNEAIQKIQHPVADL